MQLKILPWKGNSNLVAQLLRDSLFLCIVMAGAGCQRTPEDKPPILIQARPDEKRVLGSFRTVEGTNYLMAPISSTRESGYSSESYTVAYNYLFFNTIDDSTQTLLPHNDYLFVSTVALPERREGGAEDEPPPVQWFLYSLVKVDTDGDKALTDQDQRSLYVSSPDGAGFKEMVSDIEQLYGHALPDANTLVVLYRKGAKNYTTRINLPRRQEISTKELPRLGVSQ